MPRPRRDPRAELAALLVPGGRRRRIERGSRAAGPGSDAAVPTPSDVLPALPVQAANPSVRVLVAADAPGGRLTRHDRQLLGAARMLADPHGAAVVLVGAVALEPAALALAAAAGADRVLALPVPDPGRFGPDAARALLLAGVVRAGRPIAVLFPETGTGGDLARRVAALLDEPLTTHVEALSVRSAVRPARAGRSEHHAPPTRLLALEPDRVAPYAGPGRLLEVLHPADPMPPLEAASAGTVLSVRDVPGDSSGQGLAEAPFVLSAGGGLRDLDGFRELAARLGATPGASRILCDAGSMPRAAQVGASGTVLAAECYLALGISGAPQHLQGLGSVPHVIAVNTDLHAAMLARAELAIVADAHPVMLALRRLLDRPEVP